MAVPFSVSGKSFDPAAGEKGSFAISKDNIKITGWASGYINYLSGEYVNNTWKTPEQALGKAEGDNSGIVCLGRGGEITLVFDIPVKNNEGLDFAVFENSFSNYFLELANVYVSSNGIDFEGFKTVSNTASPVPSYGTVDPIKINNFAGKYRQGFGTGFDLEELKNSSLVLSGDLDLNNIKYIKIVDIPGDGSVIDSEGNKVYDPFPTYGSAGFDLDGICSLSGVVFTAEPDDGDDGNDEPEEHPEAGFGSSGGCFISSFF